MHSPLPRHWQLTTLLFAIAVATLALSVTTDATTLVIASLMRLAGG